MLKHTFFIFFLLVFVLSKTVAQDAYTDQVKKYIDKYYTLALQEQKRAGIPASITLAQAIHETDAGSSDLMTKANNHFGLKCKSDWKGETYIHSDNTPNECFKKYKTAQESYKDRSDHRKKNDRYASLFTYSITDYAAWAIGLKTCGYATNQQYSVKLIKIIEDYHLQEYTYMAIEGANAKNYPVEGNTAINKKPVRKSADVDVEDNDKTDSLRKIVDSMRIAMTTKLSTTHKDNTKAIPDNPKATKIPKAKTNDDPKTENNEEKISSATDKVFDSGKIVVINGLKAFYAYKDEMLLKYAVKYKIRYPHLLELNDLPDAPLQNNMPIYIEKKLASGTHTRHTVKKNENMQLIAQEEGMMLKRLYQLNKIEPKRKRL